MTALAGAPRLVPAAAMAVAALVGLIAGLEPVLGLGLALALVYVFIVLESLALGLAIFVAIAYLESIQGFEGLSLAKAAGGVLALGWIGTITTDRRRRAQLTDAHPVLASALLALGAWTVMSALWAEFPDVAFGDAQRWVLNLILFGIVYTAIRRPSDVRWVFALFVVGALISASLGLLTGTAASADIARLEGSGVNANTLGEVLIVAIVLAAALAACRDIAVPARALALGAAGVCVLALLLTVSRGAIAGLAVAMLAAPLLVGPRRRAVALGMVVLAVAGGACYLTVVAPDALARITETRDQGSGRTEIWKIGLRMIEDRPFTGVGAGNYATSAVHYLFEPGTITQSGYIVDDPKAAHNVYLQVQAELGAVGFLLFVGIVAFSLWSALKAARLFQAAGDRSSEMLSRALMIALLGLLAASFFSTAIFSKQLWILLALAVAIRSVAARA